MAPAIRSRRRSLRWRRPVAPARGGEGQKRTVLHPLEFAALLAAARTSGPNDHALVCLLGMLGLRVSEACAADITDIRYEAGCELRHVLGEGAKPADIPLPIPGPTRRPGGDRRPRHRPDPADPDRAADGPRRGHSRPDPGRPRGRYHPRDQPARAAPHVLHHRVGRRDRDPGHAVRHAPRRPADHPALRMAKANPGGHATHAVAAFLAGMSTG